jgi:nucleoside-diphosphate-sugar epimerase
MMKIFVAGATGAIGKQLVPRLVAAGHEVHGMTRSEAKQGMLRELGAVPVVADALDPDQVAEAVARARPDVIVHELTAIGPLDMRHFDRDFALTNRLRTEGTDHLLSAGQAVGVRRFVAQGIAGYGAYGRSGGPVKSEEDPLDPTPVSAMRETIAAARHLEEAVLGAEWTEGIVLRYGAFYGPGTGMAPGEQQFELVRRRKFPLVGDGGGVGRSGPILQVDLPLPRRRDHRIWGGDHRADGGCRTLDQPRGLRPHAARDPPHGVTAHHGGTEFHGDSRRTASTLCSRGEI